MSLSFLELVSEGACRLICLFDHFEGHGSLGMGQLRGRLCIDVVVGFKVRLNVGLWLLVVPCFVNLVLFFHRDFIVKRHLEGDIGSRAVIILAFVGLTLVVVANEVTRRRRCVVLHPLFKRLLRLHCVSSLPACSNSTADRTDDPNDDDCCTACNNWHHSHRVTILCALLNWGLLLLVVYKLGAKLILIHY